VFRVLMENLSGTDMKSTRSVTGVQMVGVIVANGLLPYTDNGDISKHRWIICTVLYNSYFIQQLLPKRENISCIDELNIRIFYRVDQIKTPLYIFACNT